MISKYLKKKVELRQNGEIELLKDSIELEYYLIESEPSQYEKFFGEKVYGVEILKREDKSGIESEIIKNLSYNKENTQNIVSLLAENKVTPMELTFVLDDLMGM